jgi:hypothetical protein
VHALPHPKNHVRQRLIKLGRQDHRLNQLLIHRRDHENRRDCQNLFLSIRSSFLGTKAYYFPPYQALVDKRPLCVGAQGAAPSDRSSLWITLWLVVI